MDAEHRHELHSNEMVKFVQNFPQIVKDNYTMVLGLLLIAAAILTYGPVRGYFRAQEIAKSAEVTADLSKLGASKANAAKSLQADPDAVDTSLLVTANALEVAVAKAKGSSLKAMTLIKRAEAIRAGLHYTSEDPEKTIVTSDIEKAKAAYNQALSLAGVEVNLMAKAEFGLGLCAEELGNFDEAGEIYNKIIANPDYQVTVFPKQAEARIEMFDDYKVKYTFVDAPVEPQAVEGSEVTGSIDVVAPEAGDDAGSIPMIMEPETAEGN